MGLPKAVTAKLSKDQLAVVERAIADPRKALRTAKSELAEYSEMLAPAGNLVRKAVGVGVGVGLSELDNRLGTMPIMGREVPASVPAAAVLFAAAAASGDKTIDDVAQAASGALGYVGNNLRRMSSEG